MTGKKTPTVPQMNETVEKLRDLSKVLKRRVELNPSAETFFPPNGDTHEQRIRLVGYVPLGDVADLLYYIADMLEE